MEGKGKEGRGVSPALLARMREIRRQLHRLPELAYQEEQTSALVARSLDELNVAYQQGLGGGTGIRAEIGPGCGPCVALRADMDALPIEEQTGLEFASQRPGVMHACGHDGHVAMLLGAASLLGNLELPGRVVLIFQPAEEAGNGAAAMIEDRVLEGVDMIFAGHIDTHYAPGIITVDEGLICSYTDPFTISVRGRGGHAARPHEAVDSVVVACNLVVNMQTLVSRRIDPLHAAVVTVGRLQAGSVHNVIAETALLEGTVRSADRETRRRIIQGMERMIQGAADMCSAEIELNFIDGLPAVINDGRAAAIARRSACTVTGPEKVISQGLPSLGGEDFSFYQEQVPGCLVRFGAALVGGRAGPAHSSRFDFDEQVLAVGASWLARVALEALQDLSGEGE